ncbi:MAG: hypothetical protein RL213_1527 [Bacteroidota bacterium]|jgi:hypothetical protein
MIADFPSSLRRIFLFSHLYLACCAGALYLHTLSLCGKSLHLTPSLMVLMAATVVYYNFHKLSYRLDSIAPAHLWKSLTDPSVRVADRILFLFGGATFMFCFLKLSVALKLAWCAMTACALLYSVPLLAFTGLRRLREIPSVKSALVAAVWATVTGVFPLLEDASFSAEPGPWFMFFSRFALVFALCVPFEIRDQNREQARNLPSVMQFGRSRVIAAAAVLLLTAATVQLLSFIDDRLPLNAFISLLIPGLTAAVLMLVTRPTWPGWYFKLVVDGVMLLPLVLLILA